VAHWVQVGMPRGHALGAASGAARCMPMRRWAWRRCGWWGSWQRRYPWTLWSARRW